ncbi:unnamed protein product [Ilex paraguariensis]|uniref:Uncharacterized protein n=1 Tax=Ilex paraguariensis TaxID=185542 RepID=A0ABC8UW92_9AQUA
MEMKIQTLKTKKTTVDDACHALGGASRVLGNASGGGTSKFSRAKGLGVASLAMGGNSCGINKNGKNSRGHLGDVLGLVSNANARERVVDANCELGQLHAGRI